MLPNAREGVPWIRIRWHILYINDHQYSQHAASFSICWRHSVSRLYLLSYLIHHKIDIIRHYLFAHLYYILLQNYSLLNLYTKYSANELATLDWWRGFLAFVVFLSHIVQIIWFPVFGDHGVFQDMISCAANYSVVFFFVISGMLISYSALNVCEGDQFHWKKFLINRIARIYPSLIFVILLCAVLVIIFPLFNNQERTIHRLITDQYLARDIFTVKWQGFIKSFFLIGSGLHSINLAIWSLAIEWWTYMSALFFFLALVSNKNTLMRILYIFLSVLMLCLPCVTYGLSGVFYIAVWYIGLLYTLHYRNAPWPFMMLVGSCLAGLLLLVYFYGLSAFNINKANNIVYGFLQIFISVLFINVSLKYSGKILFQHMASFSYTLYIIHSPLILFVFAIFHSSIKANYFYLILESITLIILIVLFSKKAAKYTEDKNKYKLFIQNYLGLITLSK